MRGLYLFMLSTALAAGLLVSGCSSTISASPAQPTAGLITATAAETEAAPAVYLGDVVNPPVQVQDFTLPSSTGEPLSMSDLDGQWRVMFIGYLHCPDFCPTTLAKYRRVKQFLGGAAASVAFVYLSVDGVRDTPDNLRAYLSNFDSEFIGLSGDDETLARIQPDYGFYYRRALQPGSQSVYTIDHSTRSYLIDPEGWLRTTFTYNTEPQRIASAIAWYVQHETQGS